MTTESASSVATVGVKRRYKAALSSSTEHGREVVLKSFLVLGSFYELIGVEDTTTGDDAFIQPIREEICGRGPYKGQYARRMGLIHVASRRVNEWSNDVLKRHTGAKKQNNEYVLDKNGNRIYYPRAYIVRMIPDEERVLDEEKKTATRKKVLNTLAKILMDADRMKMRPPRSSMEGAGIKPGASTLGVSTSEHNPPTRMFTPISYCVPARGWDLTPSELRPLSWYLTDNQVANIIYAVYDEEEIGRWNMFAENVEEAYVYFHRPYGYSARELGYRNHGESSVWLPSARSSDQKSPSVEQRFDAGDVVQL